MDKNQPVDQKIWEVTSIGKTQMYYFKQRDSNSILLELGILPSLHKITPTYNQFFLNIFTKVARLTSNKVHENLY